MDVMWDNQYRLHLRNVYKLLEAKPPSRLFDPIIVKEGAVNIQRPATEFAPHGVDDAAWAQAGRFEVSSGFGALHRPSGLASRVFYGSDQESLHLKVESSRSHAELAEMGITSWISLSGAPLSEEERALPATKLPLPEVSAADLCEGDANADVNGMTVRLAAATFVNFCSGVASRTRSTGTS